MLFQVFEFLVGHFLDFERLVGLNVDLEFVVTVFIETGGEKLGLRGYRVI